MTATVPETEVLAGLDFPLNCQGHCAHGFPPATHVAVRLSCPCPPLPICGQCAGELQRAIDNYAIAPESAATCRGCGSVLVGPVRLLFRIEPL